MPNAEPGSGAAAAQPEVSGPEGQPLKVRHAGRVILLDPDDRVLLMRYDDGPPNGIHWSTPGGGLNQGEDYATGAARELAEETGWTDVSRRRASASAIAAAAATFSDPTRLRCSVHGRLVLSIGPVVL